MSCRTSIVFCGLIAAALPLDRAIAAQAALAIHAEPVTTAPEDQAPQRIVVSPDGHHVAFVSIRGSRFVVVVDGKPSARYDEIGHTNWANNREMIFSPDGLHLMFVARKGEDGMVVVDGQELSPYAVVEQAVFSPDSKQYAFVAQRDNQNARYVVVVNGKDSPVYRKVDDLQFSSNSKHVAYRVSSMSVTKSAIQSVIVDGNGGPDFFAVRDFCFSADGNHWAYIADDNTNDKSTTPGQASHLFVDGKELAAYENIISCQLSADGHVMYAATKGTHKGPQQETVHDQCVGLDGQVWDLAPGYHFPWSQPKSAILSPDGRRVAWIEQSSNNNLYVTINGKRGLGYKTIQQLKFSLDSQHVYYVAGQASNGTYVVEDEDEAGPYGQVANANGTPFQIYLSPGGKHVAYQAGDGNMAFVVLDGKRQTPYAAFRGPMTFSAAGEHLAYIAAKDTMANLSPMDLQKAKQSPDYDPGRYLVLDGQQQRLLSSMSTQDSGVQFSPDGKHVAYLGDSGQIVVDGRLVKQPPKEQVGYAGMDLSFDFTGDSKHVLCKVGTHYVVDGDAALGYEPVVRYVRNYKPVLERDGSIFFFATKDGATPPPAQSSSGLAAPALYRVTINPGPARDFGTTGSSSDAAAKNPAPQQPGFAQQNPTGSSNTKPSQPSNPQQPNGPQQPTNTPPTEVDKAMDKAQKGLNAAQKAKDAADSIRKLFGK